MKSKLVDIINKYRDEYKYSDPFYHHIFRALFEELNKLVNQPSRPFSIEGLDILKDPKHKDLYDIELRGLDADKE